MSTFDNPFDPKRGLNRTGCSCGRHVSQIEHERDAVPALQCTPVESEDKRYQGVVASAVMRAVFPQDAARRAFLKSVGATTALAAISQFFPLGTATEVFAQGAGALEKKDLKVGFIPITCATPIIMAKPMGFYEKHGLNVEVIKTAGWAVIRDKTINKEYDAAHMLSPMPIAITHGRRLQSDPIHRAGDREHQRTGHHACDQAQGQARSEVVEGHEIRGAVRLFDAQLSAALLRGRARPRPRPGHPDSRRPAAGDGGEPPRRQHRRFSRSRSDESARRVRRRRLHPCAVEGDLGGASVLRLRGVEGVRHDVAEHLRGAAQGDHRRHRLRDQGREPQGRSPRRSLRRTTSTSR